MYNHVIIIHFIPLEEYKYIHNNIVQILISIPSILLPPLDPNLAHVFHFHFHAFLCLFSLKHRRNVGNTYIGLGSKPNAQSDSCIN